MKTLFECKTDGCRFEIKRINNGFLIVIIGICDANRGYHDAVYFRTPSDCWNQLVQFVVMGGGKVESEFNDVCWG